jgi:1-acyl-sn-glycerol-3-phosphate acyltransferase
MFKFLLSVWFVLWSPLLLLGLMSAKLTRRLIIWDAWGVLALARMVCGVKYRVRGQFAAGAIIASKHMSILEVAILTTHLPDAFFIIKRELLMIPIYGWAFWRMGFIGVNRAKGRTNMKALADRAAAKIRRGKTLVIFPEGTRARPGAGVSLKRGLLFIAETTGIPIQPVGADTGIYWPKKGRMTAGTATLWTEPVLPPTAPLNEIAAAIARHSA